VDKGRIAQNLACVDGHFHSEAENDIEAALELYTDDIIFEAGALNGLNRSFSGKQAVAKFYRELWATMKDMEFQFLQRFATEDRVVDDSLVTFKVVRDGCWPHFSTGEKIEMRLVHIFEMRDGKISRKLSSIWGALSNCCNQAIALKTTLRAGFLSNYGQPGSFTSPVGLVPRNALVAYSKVILGRFLAESWIDVEKSSSHHLSQGETWLVRAPQFGEISNSVGSVTAGD
jgi:ketosteroid isomerase-like protein